ncbi:hypothetical protein [Rhizobium wuzhouense]|uniref:XRE family transcriptional regulator n=1 Tax=Rhizobium wuzhouense TaxID=1986026 RepID=A0ABX5NRE6_9HYPH|nr:hypothetical protein [Rhizobium wuzhouense]PYB71284.1 hypothetical protein DMY87_18165 [Rhizobium wuzhouense]
MSDADSSLAQFDWFAFRLALRSAAFSDGRSQAEMAADAGVTSSDFSRLMGGHHLSIAKVIAACDWMDRDLRSFYRAPPVQGKSRACSAGNVKHSAVKHEVRA